MANRSDSLRGLSPVPNGSRRAFRPARALSNSQVAADTLRFLASKQNRTRYGLSGIHGLSQVGQRLVGSL
jgi:hypothetical protein